MNSKIINDDEQEHNFGGDWTTQKLEILSNYLKSYTIALSKQTFIKAFIDAFAGTGYRSTKDGDENFVSDQEILFPDLAEDEPQSLLSGSAKLALQVEPRFDKYLFIEQNPDRCKQLENLKKEFPHLSSDISIYQGEANQEIKNICLKVDWKSRRAVLFLDPYGMQVEWSTIEAIARTRSIDLWVLFPLGMGVNRLLTKTGEIPIQWRNRLNLLLGTEDWYDEFYKIRSTPNLFGEEEEWVVKAKMETIGKYFNNRLKEIFAGVAENPCVLRNSKNNPLFLLCFAVGNENAVKPALNIANHLIKNIQ